MRRALLAAAGVAVWLLTVAVTTVATYYVYLAIVNGYLTTGPSVYALRLVEGVAVLLLGLVWTVAVIVEFRWLAEAASPTQLARRGARALGGGLVVLGLSYLVVEYGLRRVVG